MEKPLESRDARLEFIVSTENNSWSLTKLQFVYILSAFKNKSNQPYAQRFSALLVNNASAYLGGTIKV